MTGHVDKKAKAVRWNKMNDKQIIRGTGRQNQEKEGTYPLSPRINLSRKSSGAARQGRTTPVPGASLEAETRREDANIGLDGISGVYRMCGMFGLYAPV